MQRRQSVCASTAWQSILAGLLLFLLVLGCAALSSAQVNTADLSGSVSDPSGGVVKDAKITVTSLSTGASRTATTDDSGHYSFVQLPPGRYKLSVDAGASFATLQIPDLVLTVGSPATYDAHLQLRTQSESIVINGATALIETQKTEVSQTVPEFRIENLPINGRNYINFTLTNSQTNRDAAPSIGAAPTSGLNVGGQRARSNMVSVDGADAVDNSVNGIRATVSQEAVQEFQLILSNYNAEYGRATGGVVNIVTKSGANDVHGNLFGYLRHKDIQARNPFSGEVDPVTGQLKPIKQPYTRVQAGATLGGPLKKDKTFYFLSYEITSRQETGFTSIGVNNFGLVNATTQFIPGVTLQITPAQDQAVQQLLAASVAMGNPALAKLAGSYEVFMGSASNVALNGIDYGAVASGLGVPTGPGPQFPIPVTCPAGQPVNNTATPCPSSGVYVAPLPAAYVPLTRLRGNYPVSEKTSQWSARLDQRWNNNNNSFLRVGVSPSLVTGIQVNAQNQNFGQNAGSRTSLQQSRDVSGVYQLDTIVSNNAFNQFRFQFARRGLHYGFSQLPGGSGPGINIAGFAFFGREPFSTVDRIERRFQWTDQASLVHGSHTFKTGADVDIVQIRSKKSQIFELNFGSVINFGGLSASQVSAGAFSDSVAGINLPGTTGVQSYGLGLPTTFIQGIGNSNRTFDNLPFGFFLQDSWRINRKLALNYGVRYDVEITPLFTPATAVNIAAEKALHVVEGIPRDYNNVAPRFGLAWDPNGNGKTVIRAGYGIFYDHPLLAVAFNAFTAEGALSSQLISPGGAPSACFLLPGFPNGCGAGDGPTNLNAASIFQGVLNATVPPGVPGLGYLPAEGRFDPKFPNSLFANQNFLSAGFPIPILPFTLPVAGNFQFAYAQQGNLTIEREIVGSWKFSAGYNYTHGLKLNRPRVINSTDPVLLTSNLAKAVGAGLSFSNPLTVALPTSGLGPMGGSCPAGSVGLNTPGGGSLVYASTVLPFLAQGFSGPNCSGLPVGFIGTAAAFNFFRSSGPNPSFAGPGAVGYPLLVGLAQAAGFPAGFGVPIPYNSVDQQESSGNSIYHGLTFNLTKRFSHGFELLSSYTWSHAIDDSTDLQTLLEPQDSRFPHAERGNSDFDQRHRWVTSAVLQGPSAKQGDGLWKHLFGDFTLSPIVELASGRPFAVLTGTDFRLDLGAAQGRPSVGTGAVTATSKFIKGVTFTLPNTCLDNSGAPFSVPGITTQGAGCDGNLGRNTFFRPGFFQWDMRVARRFSLGEHLKLDAIADMFNLFNRFNVGDVSPLCNPLDPAGCNAGQPTAALDPRQFQFALKVSW